MADLKAVVVNLKSLDQDIKDPIIIGGGDANSRSLKVIFTQEAQAQLTPETKVYLKWHHQELDIDGYNVFDQCIDSMHRYNVWEIKWPQKMHHEGNVLCCIELVDRMSIGQTVSFIVHVIADPHDGSHFTVTDDFTDFQNACIALATLTEDVAEQFAKWKIEFAGMKQLVEEGIAEAKGIATEAKTIAQQAKELAEKFPTDIQNPAQGQYVIYDSTKQKWVNTSVAPGGTSDYNDLLNKPQINGVTLQNNKSLGDLGIISVPSSSTEDEGKVLKVVNGVAAWSVGGSGQDFSLLTADEITTIWNEAGE